MEVTLLTICLYGAGFGIGMLLMPLVILLGTLLVGFVLRKELPIPSLFGYIYERVHGKKAYSPEREAVAAFFAVFTMVFMIIAIIIEVNDLQHCTINVLWFLLIIVPHSLRFLVDVGRNLKINHKNGDSERIAELERKLEDLSSKE